VAFDSVLGQAPAVETLRRALGNGRVHHAYRFEGPEGVGKEKVALELAAHLVCREPGAEACSECLRRATSLSADPPHVPLHPDVVLLERGLYHGLIAASEATGISVEQIRRVVLGRVGFPPHEGRALVFVIRDADQLTVQAANALLKTLEEPGTATYFVLLTVRPKRLLDTVLSRTLPIRFGPLTDEVVAEILAQRGVPLGAVEAAEGSAALALRFGDESVLEARAEFVRRVREAVGARDLGPALALAEARPGERSSLNEQLRFLALDWAREARSAIDTRPAEAERLAHAHRIVLGALRDLERNAQPALALENMMLRLRRV
jgi:DNA polymerase III subunit delta'